MTVETTIPTNEPTVVMTRIFDAPRVIVWNAITDAEHVRRWWGGSGVSSPVCTMEVRPGGRWKHVMRFPDGQELSFEFVFIDVDAPERLVWQTVGFGHASPGSIPPATRVSVTLDDLGDATRWTMIALFQSMEERSKAVGHGFCNPIAASSDRLAAYLQPIYVARAAL